jgi:hypothetical protein
VGANAHAHFFLTGVKMFFIEVPPRFKVGSTTECKINGELKRLTWRDPSHLVIEPGDVRLILAIDRFPDGLRFICGDAGATDVADYEIDDGPGGVFVGRKP